MPKRENQHGSPFPRARYCRQEPDGTVICLLCPHRCRIPKESFGVCGIRKNESGSLTLPYYGWISSLAMDPVEKKPLRHFLPGTRTYSVGFWHCNMRCPFCQNWEISHPGHLDPGEARENARTLAKGRHIEPDELIAMAVDSRAPSISFTYSEPTIHLEYVVESMKLARIGGLKTILVTNGNILGTAAHEILQLTDAVNVDFKSASPEIYRDVLGGDIETVRNFIRIAQKSCHLEVTSLLVPGILDAAFHIRTIAEFLASVSKDIPLHITRYHPAFHLTVAQLGQEAAARAAEPAFGLLSHVHFYGKD